MVVYMNGKPIFIKNPNLIQPSSTKSNESGEPEKIRIPYAEIESTPQLAMQHSETMLKTGNSHQAVLSVNTKHKNGQISNDMDYVQLVSMFKQKNEKLYNPLN